MLTLAFATDTAAPSTLTSASGGLINLLPMLGIFVIFYFFLIRPQMKKQKEQQAMISSLKKGDKVVAAGGIIGKIVKIEDDIMTIEIDNDTKIQVLRSSVVDLMNKKPVDKKD